MFSLNTTHLCRTLADQYGYLRHHNELKQKMFFGEAANYFDEAKKWVIQNASKPFEKLCMVSLYYNTAHKYLYALIFS